MLSWNLIQISESSLFLSLYLGFRTFLNFPAESSVQLAVDLNSDFICFRSIKLVQCFIQTTIYRLKAGNAGSLQKVVINRHFAVFAPLRAVINERTS